MQPTNYQELLDNVTKIVNDRTRRFSIFDMLGQSSRELTHSAFIAQMLNPHGMHGLRNTFLELFLEQLSLTKDFETDYVEVEIEKDFGPKEGSGTDAKGGRIDIYMKNSKGRIIIIENKIYATDQADQLQRYRNSTGSNSIILYLSLDGHTPFNSPVSIDYRLISYKKDIKNWLNKCLDIIPDNHSLKTIILQYMATIDNLTSDEDVTKIIQSSSSNLRAALQIERLADNARNNVKKCFLKDLAVHINAPTAEIKSFGKEYRLTMADCEWCIEHNLFVRFYNPINNGISSDQPDWIYVKSDSGETLNFHEFNAPASLWCDDPNKFWAEFSPIIDQIRSKFKLN